jgi:hypothetical protein
MRNWLLFAAAAALVAGCGKQPKINETNASVAEVANKVREAGAGQSFVRPGLWQSKVTIERLDMPGMPPEMAQRMKAMMAARQGQDFEACLTADDVARPKEDFFAGGNNQCRYEHFTMGGGKIDAVMHCGKDQGSQTMKMAGTYSPDSYALEMANSFQASNAEPAMQMQMRVDAHRIGECPAKKG